MNSDPSGTLLQSALIKKPKELLKAIDKLQCERSLRNFVDVFWPELEPAIQLVPGWCLDAITEHLEAVTYGDLTRLAINVCPGFMKECHVDEPVLTRRGRIRLGDIVVGDQVLTHKGRYRRVLGVHEKGLQPTLSITTDNGRVLRPEIKHPFLTPKGWVCAEDLVVGDVLAAVTPMTDDFVDEVSNEEARLMGYLVGDGGLSHHPNFCNADEDVLVDFERCAATLGWRTKPVAPSPSLLAKNAIFTRVNIAGALGWLETHALRGTNSYTKRIPPALLRSSNGAIANFLGAYWSCDGTFNVRHASARGSIFLGSCCTVSYELARDIQHALLRLGIHSRVKQQINRKLKSKKQPGDGGYKSYHVMTCSHEETAKMAALFQGLCARKVEKIKGLKFQRFHQGPLHEDKIIQIEQADPAECRCLTVEEDHSFTIHDIAVHNSLLTNVFWPAWEWGPMNMPTIRTISTSYSEKLTLRDNLKFKNIIMSDLYRELWGDIFTESPDQFTKHKIANSRTGWKIASSVGGTITGERGNRFVCLKGDSFINTDHGLIRIKQIVENKMPVRIYGWSGSRLELQEIESFQQNPARPMIRVTSDEGPLECTVDHRIFVADRGWVEAQHLCVGDELLAIDQDYCGAAGARVTNIEILGDTETATYNLSVVPHHNYFANGILVKNCDDPNSVQEAESESVRDQTNQWFRETVPTRLNNQNKDAIVVIQQRVHELDVTGLIWDLGLEYTKLIIPMEYDSTRHCTTVLGRDEFGEPDVVWNDPRGLDDDGNMLEGRDLDEADGELAWPERYNADAVQKLKDTLGPYAYAGQFQQTPNPRGGGIFRVDWWKSWPPEDWPELERERNKHKYPDMSYIVASLDPALGLKQENDFTALTIWGVWRSAPGVAKATKLVMDESGPMRIPDAESPKIMLMYGFAKRLQLHGPIEEKPPLVSDEQWNGHFWLTERMKNWGIVELVQHYCRIYRVDLLMIEKKAGGEHIASELQRQLGVWSWGIQLVNPGNFDKVSRAHSVVHLFSGGDVYAPKHKDWCDEIIYQAARFPRGKNDDLVDSMTQALRHLRDTRHALRKEEADADWNEELRLPSRKRKLYPV